jgi:hypothetical protein
VAEYTAFFGVQNLAPEENVLDYGGPSFFTAGWSSNADRISPLIRSIGWVVQRAPGHRRRLRHAPG